MDLNVHLISSRTVGHWWHFLLHLPFVGSGKLFIGFKADKLISPEPVCLESTLL